MALRRGGDAPRERRGKTGRGVAATGRGEVIDAGSSGRNVGRASSMDRAGRSRGDVADGPRRSLAWRKASGVKNWPSTKLRAAHWPCDGDAADVVAATWRAGWYGCDREGRALFIDRTVGMNLRPVLGEEKWVDRVVDLAMAEAERHTELCARHGALAGKLFETHTVLVDCEGLGLGIRRAVPVLRRISTLAGEHYPDTVHQILVVRAPRLFSWAWGLVKPWIDPATREKFQVLRDAAELFELIPPEALPCELGGTCDQGGVG